ncbi:hypothetical protein AKJ09_09422 [Labilithrix luteola]|uniref:Long-chain fatty acid transport protein n=1 Tax=Labilithrix luteola TaxID=1391654 RepID=A0A0K1QAK0_9BACT|nr:hypothetical protein [Labilithrix luteola]AKV02759.1 hypothetical protein AKJ09_09422 [Labilithrix luteola]
MATTLVVSACAFAWSGATSASPEDLFGYGARTSAMGATGVAHATGYESAFHNPALASTTRENKLTLGYTGAVFRLDAKGDGLPGRTSVSPARGAVIGAELPVPLGGVLARRVGVVMAFYEPTDVVVRGRVLYPEKTQFPMLDNRAQSITIRAGIGVDVGYGVRVGAGFAALAEVVGTVVAATDATGRVGTRVEDQLVATYAPVFGATYDLPARGPALWTAGLVYRGTLDARFAVVIDGTKLSSLQIPLFNISGVAQYDPAQVAFELARTLDLDTFAAQFVYKRWSSFPGIIEPTVVCNSGGAGACGILPPAIDWRDTFAVRVGGDHGVPIARGAEFHARGGVFYEMSPLPSQLPTAQAFDAAAKGAVDVPVRYFDSDRLVFTAGAGLRLKRPLPPIDIDFFAQYHVLLPRTIRSAEASGTILSEGEASGHVLVFGLNAGVRF